MKYFDIVYNNGNWEKISKSSIPITNLGFQFGYGVFETIKFSSSKIISFDKHLLRLSKSLKKYSIDYKIDYKNLHDLILDGIKKNDACQGTIKIIITPHEYKPTSYLFILYRKQEEIKNLPVLIKFFNEEEYDIKRSDSFYKSLNYIGNYIASRMARKEGYFEPIFYNINGHVTEGAFRNIFFIKNNKLFTPPLSMGILPGTTRESVLLIAKNLNIAIDESKIDIDTVNDMDEAFITSAGIGVVPCKWDKWNSQHILTNEIKNKFDSMQKIE